MGQPYEKEMKWAVDKINGGHKISTSEPFYQTLKRAQANVPAVAAFMKEYSVASHTY